MTTLMHSELDVHDSDGRPLGEIRAPSRAKVNVPMVLKACPYHDERAGRPMNVSALEQITRHLPATLHDIAAFRTYAAGSWSGWEAMLLGVVDQLTGPHRFLLTSGLNAGPVPARLAVGHKLAAGFFGVLMNILEEQALRPALPCTLGAFLEATHQQQALIGASEVCAGPPNLITKCAAAWLDPEAVGFVGAAPMLPWQDLSLATRLDLAAALAAQLALGQAFGLYDRRVEAEFIRAWGPHMTPTNPYMHKLLEQRQARDSSPPPVADAPGRALPHFKALSPECAKLAEWLAPEAELSRATTQDELTLEALIRQRSGALNIDGDRSQLAAKMMKYFRTYRMVVAQQWRWETELRTILAVKNDSPVQLGSRLLPVPRALPWFEAILGLKLRCQPGEHPDLIIRSHKQHFHLGQGADRAAWSA